MKLKWLLQQFDAAVCVYVPRACNVPTHKVLKFSVSINVKMWEVALVPSWLSPHLSHDIDEPNVSLHYVSFRSEFCS